MKRASGSRRLARWHCCWQLGVSQALGDRDAPIWRVARVSALLGEEPSLAQESHEAGAEPLEHLGAQGVVEVAQPRRRGGLGVGEAKEPSPACAMLRGAE